MATRDTPQSQLLSSVRLQINPRLVRARPEPDAVVLRASGRAERLIVTPAHEQILADGFSTYRTVPEALVRTITDARCPPLREFYELIVQAHETGILVTEPPPAPTSAQIRWPARLPAKVATILGGGLSLVSLVVLAATIRHWRGPDSWVDVAAGWLVACALLCLGEVLAACAVASCGEVHSLRVHWRTRFPHFRVDTTEAIMGGRAFEVAVAALRAAPILAGTALATWRAPDWLAALNGGALLMLAPFGHSAARQWLASRRKSPRYSIRADFHFEPVRGDLWARGLARWRAFFGEFGWAGVAWSLVWCGWSFVAFVRCMPNTAATLAAWTRGAPRPLHLGAEYLLLAAIALGLLFSLGAWLRHAWLQRAWSRPLRGADARDRHRPPLTGDPAEMLAAVPLFQSLDPSDRAALAGAMTVVNFGSGDEVTREDESGDDFFLVVEGELAVQKRPPGKRRPVTIGWLGPGDCFGEIALLEDTTRTATIVARRPCRLLQLDRADFARLVVGRVGAARIRELLQHARFLGRLTFTTGWPFAELVKFARRCRTVRVEAGLAPITQGEPNHWFYLIYDGTFEAREGQRVLRRMGPGDYFGEISLLEGWQATATVVALEEGRCLALSRADFLELFARDFHLGLRMESIAGQRLGGRVFASR